MPQRPRAATAGAPRVPIPVHDGSGSASARQCLRRGRTSQQAALLPVPPACRPSMASRAAPGPVRGVFVIQGGRGTLCVVGSAGAEVGAKPGTYGA